MWIAYHLSCFPYQYWGLLMWGRVGDGGNITWWEGRDRWGLELWDMPEQIQKENQAVANKSQSIILLIDKCQVGDVEYGLLNPR